MRLSFCVPRRIIRLEGQPSISFNAGGTGMRFMIAEALFRQVPALCVGGVLASSVDNSREVPAIASFLQEAVSRLAASDVAIREHPHVAVWRDAFARLGVNPNKYPSSIEALGKRVLKGQPLPHINAVVDLVNALSVKYVIPMGAHDLDLLAGDVALRFSEPGDVFLAWGSAEPEAIDVGEVVYATGSHVRTRKWVWRQGEQAKVDSASQTIFFPIDAFYGHTDAAARAAQEELADWLAQHLGAQVQLFWVDQHCPEVTLRLP